MKSRIIPFALALAATLGPVETAAAQGTSGGQGVVASIPGSVVRGPKPSPGLFSILAGTPTPNYGSDLAQRARRTQSHTTSGQTRKYPRAQAGTSAPPPQPGAIGANDRLPVGPPPN